MPWPFLARMIKHCFVKSRKGLSLIEVEGYDRLGMPFSAAPLLEPPARLSNGGKVFAGVVPFSHGKFSRSETGEADRFRPSPSALL